MTGVWTKSDYLLTGLARCASCRAMIRAKTAGGRTIYDYYLCTTRYEQGKGACVGGLIRQRELDYHVYRTLMEHIGVMRAKERLVQKRVDYLQGALDSVGEQVADLEREMIRSEAQKAKLRQKYREEFLTATDYEDAGRCGAGAVCPPRRAAGVGGDPARPGSLPGLPAYLGRAD